MTSNYCLFCIGFCVQTDHHRIVATGPAVSSLQVPISFAEVMVIQKNRCRTTVLSRFGEMLAELSFIGDQVVCLGRRPGRLERTCINELAKPNCDDREDYIPSTRRRGRR